MHGEFKHLSQNKLLAEMVGVSPDNILIPETGKIIELDKKSIKTNGYVTAGNIMVDGLGVGDVGSVVLRDRKHLAQDGIVMVVAALDLQAGYLLSGPDIVSRGFVYVKESEELMEEMRQSAYEAIDRCLDAGIQDANTIKNNLRDDLAKHLYSKTRRRPMILPVLMDL
jgi:ribonuclease J